MTEAAPPADTRPAHSGVRVLPLDVSRTVAELGDVEARGGFGSGLAVDPREPERFWILTGRGPGFDTGKPFERGFALPSFTPSIARFLPREGVLVPDAEIELRATGGRRLSGLPNPLGEGGTGESPVTWDARPLPLDRDGIDPRGLAVLPDGTFWVADSYGPSLLHVDESGRTLLRINPLDPGRHLPRVLARRAPNRGFSGLTATPDGRTLVAVVQAPLWNPDRETGEESRITRIVAFDIATGRTRQYLHVLEDRGLSISGIAAESATSFLAIERDAFRPGDPRTPSWIKRVNRIELKGATDVTDPADDESGLRIGGRTLEELAPEELRDAGVEPVHRSLALDLLPLDYPHDKPSGLALLDGETLAVLNDDDFGIATPARVEGRRVVPKIMPRTGRLSQGEIWLIPLPHPVGTDGP